MITLNFANVEELVFKDPNIQSLLLEYRDCFQQWKLGQIVPYLKPTAQKATLDFLNQLTSDQIKILENHWKQPVEIERLDYTIVKNYEVKITESEDWIKNLDGLEGEIFLYRDADTLYIGGWR
jgi:hypothetical protein